MKFSPLLFLSLFILGGCDLTETNPDCSLVLCLYEAKSLKIKYIDKNTGSPLFSANSGYKLSDLKVPSSTDFNYIPEIKFDSPDSSVITLTHLINGQSLTLGNFPADKITMQTRALGKECCSGYEITSIKINDETICAPCNDLPNTIAVIKK